jgi:glycosyltransferase involved in cell wall biosynthesis
MGGIGTYCRTLLDSALADHVDLRFVQTSSQRRTLLASGHATVGNLLEALRDCGRFFRACLAHRPGIVHICTAPGLSFLKNGLFVILARLAGCRVLLHPHCGFAKLYGDSRYWQWFCARIFRLSSAVLALSREWVGLERILPGVRVHYLPNAIDTRPYEKIASRRSRTEGHPVRLLYLGYLGEAKGTYDLLEAFRIMDARESEVILHLVGDFLTDQEKGRLSQVVARSSGRGKTCFLLPPVTGDEKLACFERADIFVFPSHNEGMPMAILEAMASGLPVVATAVGGIPDLVADGSNGFLTAPGEPRDLARSIEKLCSDAGLRSEFGSRNAVASRDHDVQRYIQDLQGIYARVLSRGE